MAFFDFRMQNFGNQRSYRVHFWFWWKLRLYILWNEIVIKGDVKGRHIIPYETIHDFSQKMRNSPKKRILKLQMKWLWARINVLDLCLPFSSYFSCIPFCIPYHIQAPSIEIMKKTPFLARSSIFGGAYSALHPLSASPFSRFEKFKRSSTFWIPIMYPQNDFPWLCICFS